MTDPVPLFEIDWGRDEILNVVDSVTRGSHWAKGPYIEKFEAALESYHGVDHAVVFNSGTTALVSALEVLDLQPSDEVIVPSFTFIATANAVRLAGGTPVFADIEREHYGLDPDAVRAAITADTVAIVPVHYAGLPCRIRELESITAEHDVALVEDAAEAQGAKVGDEIVGGIGDLGVLSFCQNKIISTGEGGAVLTDDDEFARGVELMRSHGRVPGNYFEEAGGGTYIELGNNFRMADINAALGVAQLRKIEDVIAARRRVAEQYNEALSAMDGIDPPSEPPDCRHVYQLYTITLDDAVKRDALIEALERAGVSSKVYFEPVHETAVYRNDGHGTCELSRTEDIAGRVLSLPMASTQSRESTGRVIDALRDAVN